MHERTHPPQGREAQGPVLQRREFELLARLIETECGIAFPASKRGLLESRLRRRLIALGIRSFARYFRLVSSPGGADEFEALIDRVTTQETRFFRQPAQFDFLRDEVFSKWQRELDAGERLPSARVWSAACSTGEEPYSVAMALNDAFGHQPEWQLEVLATDRSLQALEQGARGVYTFAQAEAIPPDHLKKYLLKGHSGQRGKVRVGPELREIVTFEQANLISKSPSHWGRFDIIFCRNVLIYFSPRTAAAVVARLTQHLAADGLLLVGHAEGLSLIDPAFQRIAPGIYRRETDDVRRATP